MEATYRVFALRACSSLGVRSTPQLLGRALSSSTAGLFRSGKQVGRWYDVWRVGADGARQRGPISHQQLLARASLFPRDLLTFDVSNDASSHGSRPPRILVRADAILLTAGHLRCVIRKDEVFLFDADRLMVTDFARQLAFKLTRSAVVENAARAGIAHWANTPPTGPSRFASADGSGEGEADPARAGTVPPGLYPLHAPGSPHLDVPPFEMRALDLVLEEVTASYARRAALLSPMVESLLERMVTDAAPYSAAGLGLGDVSMLLPLRDSLNVFELEASNLVSVLVALLDSDEDMVDMLLTEKHALRGERPPPAHHVPVELLLEEYVRQMASVLSEAQALKKRVASASELAQLHLDISRNRMVATNVHLSMVSTALAVVMTASGIFGMNLTSGLENDSVAFQLVTASSGAAGLCMLAVCWSYLHGFRGGHRQQQLSLQLQSASAIRTVVRKLDSLQYVLANKLRAPQAAASAVSPLSAFAALPVHEGGTAPSSASAAAAPGEEAGKEEAGREGGAAPLSLNALRREVEEAAGSPLSAQELEIIVRLIQRNEAGKDGGGVGAASDGSRLSRSQLAALWRRVALPRDLWFASDVEPPAAAPAHQAEPPADVTLMAPLPPSDSPADANSLPTGVGAPAVHLPDLGAGGGCARGAAERTGTRGHASSARHAAFADRGDNDGRDALASILDRRRAPQPNGGRTAS